MKNGRTRNSVVTPSNTWVRHLIEKHKGEDVEKVWAYSIKTRQAVHGGEQSAGPGVVSAGENEKK